MGIVAWLGQKAKAYTFCDIQILKIACLLVGMILGAYISPFVFRFMVWFIGVSILLLVALAVRIFRAKANS